MRRYATSCRGCQALSVEVDRLEVMRMLRTSFYSSPEPANEISRVDERSTDVWVGTSLDSGFYRGI
jgi:hypothetical protein